MDAQISGIERMIFTTRPCFTSELRKNKKVKGKPIKKWGRKAIGSKAFFKRYDSLVAKNRGTACPTVLDRLFYFRLLTDDLGIWTQGYRRSLAERALYEHYP